MVKVGWDGADEWPAWATWCQDHPGPHVPVVHACLVIVHDARRVGFVGVVERLGRAEAHRSVLAQDRTLKHCPARFAAAIELRHPTVATMLRAAHAAFPVACWELTPSNWMQRPCGTLVLTDPLSPAGEDTQLEL